jgi:hypothetical protein
VGWKVVSRWKGDRPRFNGPLVLTKREYFSMPLIARAAQLSREAATHEEAAKHVLSVSEIPITEHKGAVIGAVVLSCCFLEAAFNEFIEDLKAQCYKAYSSLERGDDFLRQWGHKQKNMNKMKPIEMKYQNALKEIRGCRIDEKSILWRDCIALRKLRNYLVHNKSEADCTTRIRPQ